jgi:hypothetical protein
MRKNVLKKMTKVMMTITHDNSEDNTAEYKFIDEYGLFRVISNGYH